MTWVDWESVGWKTGKSEWIALYSLAREKGLSKNNVHRIMSEVFNKETSKDLDYEEYQELMNTL